MNDLGTVVAAGLGSAAAFGAGDFSGGLAKKRDPVVRVVALAHLLSLGLFVVLALIPSPDQLADCQLGLVRSFR